MENSLTIESPQNPRVKAAVKLRKRNVRNATQQTLVEGYREILRADESGWAFTELYVCPALYLDSEAQTLVAKIRSNGTPVLPCSEIAFRKMSYRDTPDGLMALSPLVGKKIHDLELPDNPLVLITENLEKPGNLGTILRTADATGVDAVIVCGNKTDLNNPNVIRASIGTLFFIPIAEASTEETLHWLRKQNIRPLAAVPDAGLNYTEANLCGRTALVVGAEDEGLTSTWFEHSIQPIGIPMQGKNDSLNVATAAAILLYEAVRQRQNSV